ncbi:hypothetical protein [Streptomyces youssoufiensis]
MRTNNLRVIAATAMAACAIGVAAPAASAIDEHRTSQAASARLDAGRVATVDSTQWQLPAEVVRHDTATKGFSDKGHGETASTRGLASKLIGKLKKVPGYAKAVAGGFKNFKKWWDTKVPKTVKWGIKVAFGLDSAQDVWDEPK